MPSTEVPKNIWTVIRDDIIPGAGDILSGAWTAIIRNSGEFLEEAIAGTNTIDDFVTGWKTSYEENLEKVRKTRKTYVEKKQEEAGNLTLFYIGNCIGDIVTIVTLLKAGQNASPTDGSTGAASTVLKGQLVTAEGVVIEVDIEGSGTLVGVMGLPSDHPSGMEEDIQNLWESIFGIRMIQRSEGSWSGEDYDDWLDSDVHRKKPIKGREFRGGKKKDRDRWYGINDKEFQKWWDREGKELWGGTDINSSDMATEAYEDRIESGKPNANGGKWK